MNLNEEVAKARGLTTYIFSNDPIPLVWVTGKDGPEYVVDYLNDGNLLAPLEDELLEAGWCLYKDFIFYRWEKSYPDGETASEWAEDVHRGTATCLAYCVYKGVEDDF